jgi:hypothetical protein
MISLLSDEVEDLDKLSCSDHHTSAMASAKKYSPVAAFHEAMHYLASYHHFLRGNHDISEPFINCL